MMMVNQMTLHFFRLRRSERTTITQGLRGIILQMDTWRSKINATIQKAWMISEECAACKRWKSGECSSLVRLYIEAWNRWILDIIKIRLKIILTDQRAVYQFTNQQKLWSGKLIFREQDLTGSMTPVKERFMLTKGRCEVRTAKAICQNWKSDYTKASIWRMEKTENYTKSILLQWGMKHSEGDWRNIRERLSSRLALHMEICRTCRTWKRQLLRLLRQKHVNITGWKQFREILKAV